MNGWTAAGLLIGFMVGMYYGARAENRRLKKSLVKYREETAERIDAFAKNFPQDVIVHVIDKDGQIVAEGSNRQNHKGRVH